MCALPAPDKPVLIEITLLPRRVALRKVFEGAAGRPLRGNSEIGDCQT